MKSETTSSTPYVCAFRGRRDYYQVPLALAESNQLDRFFTDFYAKPAIHNIAGALPPSIREKVRFRQEPGIPSRHIKCLWKSTASEFLRHRLGHPRYLTYARLDADYSRAAASRAGRTRSNLLLYNPYAWEAFRTSYPHSPRRVLFQFHPHPEFEQNLLSTDASRFPVAKSSFSNDIVGGLPEALRQRERDCWKHADLIICASSFTKQSLLEVGAEESRCVVIPYGIDLPTATVASEARSDSFHALFLGSGVQRKGLHHLLLAWQKASLPSNSRLTLVCRSIDPELEKMALETPRLNLIRGASMAERDELFNQATLFVMPSLVEGFGQVFLEALSFGLPVLGTSNTCLPDLGKEADGIFLTEAGNVDALIAKLEELAQLLPGNAKMREKAQACAARFSWGAFREKIRSVL